jgi:pyruvate kinase
LEDGACDFTVVTKEDDSLTAEANVASQVNDRKTMNTPGTILEMPSLTQRDFAYLDHIDPQLIDFVGLSFVRNKRDIEILQAELDKRNCQAEIIAKIENQSAIDNIDSIIEAADAVMVARGDLGVEVPYQELIHWQKIIIAKCRTAARPVITATEMLQSMIENPRPTRAEVSDVAHAVYDGTDAVMLSGETTTGKYPVKSVATQATIAKFNEPFAKPMFEHLPEFDSGSAISMSAISIHENSSVDISKIICLTETGKTARLISRFHPSIPVIALTSSDETVRKLVLSYGVTSHKVEIPSGTHLNLENITEICRQHQLVESGETILLVYGNDWQTPGFTNSLSLVTVS